MYLNDSSIRRWAANGGLTPYTPANVNPASVDLTWSGLYRTPAPWSPDGWSAVKHTDKLLLWPWQFVLASTAEYVSLQRNQAGWLVLKSTTARRGINHLLAGYVDPGFAGELTLELFNVYPFPRIIRKGERIAQMVMGWLDAAPERDYSQTGRYQGQAGPTPARESKE